MSAYVVDPRTVDYLVAWVARHRTDHDATRTVRIWDTMDDVPEDLRLAVDGGEDYGYRLVLDRITRDDLGRILLAENVRSVRARYDSAAPDDLPGPVDQTRVWGYTFQAVGADALRPTWVIKACDCLIYQSCETPDYRDTLAYAVTDAIREDAIRAATDDAPWGITGHDLNRARELARA